MTTRKGGGPAKLDCGPPQPLDIARLRKLDCSAELIDALGGVVNRKVQGAMEPDTQTVRERQRNVQAVRDAAAAFLEAYAALGDAEASALFMRTYTVVDGLPADQIDRTRSYFVHLIAACDLQLMQLAGQPVQARRPDPRGVSRFVDAVVATASQFGVAASGNESSLFMNIMDVCLCAAGLVDGSGLPINVEHHVRAAVEHRRQLAARFGHPTP